MALFYRNEICQLSAFFVDELIFSYSLFINPLLQFLRNLLSIMLFLLLFHFKFLFHHSFIDLHLFDFNQFFQVSCTFIFQNLFFSHHLFVINLVINLQSSLQYRNQNLDFHKEDSFYQTYNFKSLFTIQEASKYYLRAKTWNRKLNDIILE